MRRVVKCAVAYDLSRTVNLSRTVDLSRTVVR